MPSDNIQKSGAQISKCVDPEDGFTTDHAMVSGDSLSFNSIGGGYDHL